MSNNGGKINSSSLEKKIKDNNLLDDEDVVEDKTTVTKKSAVSKEYSSEKSNTNPKKFKRHLSFEARVLFMSVTVLILFGISCLLILEALNFGKNEVISYNENGKVDYKVCLTPNEFYTNQCLEEGMEYVSGMINYISTNFSYDVSFSTNVDYDLAYHVSALTKIYDKNDASKILYQDEEIIVDKTSIEKNSKSINVFQELKISYAKYNQVVSEYNAKYSLDSLADEEVILYLDEPTEVRNVASITIPLGKQTFGITKSAISNINKTVEINNNVWNQYNSVCAFLATFLIVIALMILFKTTRLVLKVTTNKNKYQARIQQLLREYDRCIVIARDGYETNVVRKVIKVETFDELLVAKESLNKPIIFSKVNDVKCEFIVEDTDTLYKYVLKEADL